jgi:hypothetical protein
MVIRPYLIHNCPYELLERKGSNWVSRERIRRVEYIGSLSGTRIKMEAKDTSETGSSVLDKHQRVVNDQLVGPPLERLICKVICKLCPCLCDVG